MLASVEASSSPASTRPRAGHRYSGVAPGPVREGSREWEASGQYALPLKSLSPAVQVAELMGLPLEEHVTNVIGFMRLQADALGLRGTL